MSLSLTVLLKLWWTSQINASRDEHCALAFCKGCALRLLICECRWRIPIIHSFPGPLSCFEKKFSNLFTWNNLQLLQQFLLWSKTFAYHLKKYVRCNYILHFFWNKLFSHRSLNIWMCVPFSPVSYCTLWNTICLRW